MAIDDASDETILETALMAARTAGHLLSEQFGRPQRCESKPYSSVVTEADIASERVIRDVIASRHPDHAFWGEETGRADRNSPYLWVVDPLDGTKNFVRGIPLFSVEVALLKDGVPQIGVSNLPMIGDLLWAIRGKGTHCDSGAVHVSAVSRFEAAYVSFGNVKHFQRTDRLSNLMELLAPVSQCRGIGDAWSLHLLARGNVDVFLDAWTALWDIAALSVIVEEAGGRVTDFHGKSITSDSKSILASNSILHAAALSHL